MIEDAFALLQEPRRPWLDPEQLKQKFHNRSGQLHPDRLQHAPQAEQAEAQKRYTQLNAAYQRLRDPKERLRHLLELELGVKPPEVQEIPPASIQLFSQVNVACRQADAVLAEKRAATSALLQVQLFESVQTCAEQLRKLQQQLQSETEQLLRTVREIDANWDRSTTDIPARKSMLNRLQDLYRWLSFLGRWSAQLQQRALELSL